jgi:AcrR family transcriptional regulator
MAEVGGAARGAATRARLLAAARDVVADVGYAHATTRAIAAAAGVAEGTIYRHFPDKHALFLAAVIDANEPVIAWMAGLPDRAGEATLAANLAESLTLLSGLREHMLPLELATLTDPELADRRRAGMAAMGGGGTSAAVPGLPTPNPPDLLAQYLAAEQRLGRVRADVDPARAAVTVLAALMGLAVLPGPDAPGSPIPEDLLATAADILARGLQ